MPTDTNFLLPPGPELDKAVAEALGLEAGAGGRGVWVPEDCPPWSANAHEIPLLAVGVIGLGGLKWLESVPSFSENLISAFWALERFCEHDPNLAELDAFSADIEWRGHWSVSIWGGDGNKGQYKDVVSLVYLEDDASALPHAICLAIIRMKARCQ